MKRMALILSLGMLLSMAGGCQQESQEDVQEGALAFQFDFANEDHGFSGDFTDLPADYEEDLYQLKFEHAPRPASLDSDGKALMLSGRNASDDLFMYLKKGLDAKDGIEPDTTYEIEFRVELATNAPAGAVGIGGPPGEAVWVKVGAAPVEPVPVEKEEGGRPYLLPSVDKGRQNDDGEHALRVGDVAKETCELLEPDAYEKKVLGNEGQPLRMRSDEQGNLWIFVGTDSGFEGETTLYYTQIDVTLIPAG